VSGRSVYGVKGTGSVGELYDEIALNAEDLAKRTGKRPRFYRSGTAYYDEVAVKVADALGQEVAGFSLLGDAGATFTSARVRDALLAARPGDVALLHANHPEAGTGRGVMEALPLLRERGYRFVRLSEVELE
jgi:peptidoglycan/xylan/chitin deacetylase (PgdA/CDA1 family)